MDAEIKLLGHTVLSSDEATTGFFTIVPSQVQCTSCGIRALWDAQSQRPLIDMSIRYGAGTSLAPGGWS